MCMNSMCATRSHHGFTLVELLIALALSAMLFTGLGGLVGQAFNTRDTIHNNNDLTRQARFAMDQMARAVSTSPQLLLPFNDKLWSSTVEENIHNVLALKVDHVVDLDGDGIPDADDDGDGRFDEDPSGDVTNDGASGIYLIDDDVDGNIDEISNVESDDESTSINDDPVDGVDDDDDQNLDEDPPGDINADGCPGVCGVDDDGDGSVDESSVLNDDEDNLVDEDWINPVVFHLIGTQLIQRTPVPWDEDGDADIDGRDFVESVIADNVSQFRVERLSTNGERYVLVDLTLELTSPITGENVSLNTRVRVGGAL